VSGTILIFEDDADALRLANSGCTIKPGNPTVPPEGGSGSRRWSRLLSESDLVRDTERLWVANSNGNGMTEDDIEIEVEVRG